MSFQIICQVDADNWIIASITIAAGPCKLRANNTWGGAGGRSEEHTSELQSPC